MAANTTNIATNTTNITNLTDAVDSLGDDSLLWNATAGAFSAAHGTDATSKITNVKDGDLTAGSTDAVNGSQLKTTNDAVAANTTNIATNTTNITNLTDAVDRQGIVTEAVNSVSQVGDVSGVRGDIGGVGCHGIVSGFQLRAVYRVSATSRQVTVFDVGDFAGGIGTVRGAERGAIPQQGIVFKVANGIRQVGDVGGVGCHIIVSSFELRAVNRVGAATVGSMNGSAGLVYSPVYHIAIQNDGANGQIGAEAAGSLVQLIDQRVQAVMLSMRRDGGMLSG